MVELRRRWPAIRAALIALHLVAIVLVSFPGDRKVGDRKRWDLQRSQDEIALWATRLSGWGWQWSPAELDAALWDLTRRYLAVRGVLVAPFAPYVAIAGVSQTWGLFSAPTRKPYALVIEIREAGAWKTVHQSNSSEADYLADTLGNNRMRKQVGRTGRDGKLFNQLARWLARRAFADYPDADATRIRVEELDGLEPDAVRAGTPPRRRTVRRLAFTRGQLE
jgi:hypothetical protein